MLIVRKACERDQAEIWAILAAVILAGETYTLDVDLSREDALAYWFSDGHEVFVAVEDDVILGTYYMRRNQHGGGSHVANCGYMTKAGSTGRGVARTMCEHSLEHARTKGFLAMQFNFVVSSNERAVALWERFGFVVVGRLPEAFRHPRHGLVDALVMHRKL